MRGSKAIRGVREMCKKGAEEELLRVTNGSSVKMFEQCKLKLRISFVLFLAVWIALL